MTSGDIAQVSNFVPAHSKSGYTDRRWFGYDPKYDVLYASGIPFQTPTGGATTSLSITVKAYNEYGGATTPAKTYNVLITSSRITSWSTLSSQSPTKTISIPATTNRGTSTVTFSVNVSLSPRTTYYFYIWFPTKNWSLYTMSGCSITATYSSGTVRIYTSSGWKEATPYIYTSSGWKVATPYVYTSSGWKISGG